MGSVQDNNTHPFRSPLPVYRPIRKFSSRRPLSSLGRLQRLITNDPKIYLFFVNNGKSQAQQWFGHGQAKPSSSCHHRVPNPPTKRSPILILAPCYLFNTLFAHNRRWSRRALFPSTALHSVCWPTKTSLQRLKDFFKACTTWTIILQQYDFPTSYS